MLVRAVIVQYQVQLHFFGKFVDKPAQEFQEFLMAISRKALTDDFTLQNLQGGEKGPRSRRQPPE